MCSVKPEEFTAIKERTEAATSGPVRWFGSSSIHYIYLATVDRARQFVMTFKRWGMQNATPEFHVDGLMVPARKLATYEVPHRKDFASIEHPDAIFIERAFEDMPALIVEVERLQALKKYARHKGNCLLSGNLRTRVCTCGFKEAVGL